MKEQVKETPGGGAETGRNSGYNNAEYSVLAQFPLPVERLAPCVDACPQGIAIREALVALARVDKRGYSDRDAVGEAWTIWTQTNPLPAVCGRVCPHPCETVCNRTDRDQPVAIASVERFLGDWGLEHDWKYTPPATQRRPERVAVVGAGPAGLACAYHLARQGYQPTIFEAAPHPGGMLRYGIPSFRLPRNIIDAEVQRILDFGVGLRTGVTVGVDVPLDSLRDGFDALFLGLGAQRGAELAVTGADVEGVLTGVDFLRRVNMGETVPLGERVVVVGGGDTAVDAARVARRNGAEVILLYRRTRDEMPAIEREVREAEEEGVKLRLLAAPAEVITSNGRIAAVRCQEMQLGAPDESGRRRPVPVEGRLFTLETATVIAAVSQVPHWDGLEQLRENDGWLQVDGWRATRERNVYAGGDVTGLGLVTEALASGKRAAEAIHARLQAQSPLERPLPPVIYADEMNLDAHKTAPRRESQVLPPGERLQAMWEEVSHTLPKGDAVAEAGRCMSCGSTEFKSTSRVTWFRRAVQLGVGTLLFNSYFNVIGTKTIYAGPLKSVCVPGLNCHACPTALMGCPIGMLQHFSATHRFPFFLIGFLVFLGLIGGRAVCGWVCPFGLLQDVTHAFKKVQVRIPHFLNHFKYVVLVVLVLVIPYITHEHWFSKLCPNGALIAAIPWALWNPADPTFGFPPIAPEAVGTMFWVKMWILGVFLVLFLFIKRPFCRTVCPLGAIYALFNKISILSLRVTATCTDCGRCPQGCPMDLDIRSEINSENCIKCYECLQCEHVKFAWNLPWRTVQFIPTSQPSDAGIPTTR